MEPYRLDEVEDVWRRLAQQAWLEVAPAETRYRLAALRIVARRARATQAGLPAYMSEHEWSADVKEMREVVSRLANIRHAARAAHDSVALQTGRDVRPWPSGDES